MTNKLRFVRPIKTKKKKTNKLRFARRGAPYQETPTTPLSTGGTLTSAAAARTPWCSTASSAWRWRTFPKKYLILPFFTFQVENVACGGAIASRGVCPECSQLKSTCTKSIVVRCLFFPISPISTCHIFTVSL